MRRHSWVRHGLDFNLMKLQSIKHLRSNKCFIMNEIAQHILEACFHHACEAAVLFPNLHTMSVLSFIFHDIIWH